MSWAVIGNCKPAFNFLMRCGRHPLCAFPLCEFSNVRSNIKKTRLLSKARILGNCDGTSAVKEKIQLYVTFANFDRFSQVIKGFKISSFLISMFVFSNTTEEFAKNRRPKK